jgi:hypothetical protein
MAEEKNPIPNNSISIHNPVQWIIFGIYSILVLYGISIHEPWRDEAQSWLVTRDHGIVDLFKSLPSEGHPPLWYLFLLPLAKLGLPYYSQNVLAGLILIFTAWLLLFKSKLPFWLSACILFSHFFVYEFAVFARNYCIVALFTSMVLVLYPYRFTRPFLYIVALIALYNTHALVFAFAFGLTISYIYELIQKGEIRKRKYLTASLLLLIGGLYLIPYLAITTQSGWFGGHPKYADRFFRVVSNGILSQPDYSLIAILFLLFFMFVAFIADIKIFIAFTTGLAGLMYILVYKFDGDVRHHGLLYLMIVCCAGIIYREKDAGSKPIELVKYMPHAIIFITLFHYKTAFTAIQNDIHYEYSDSKNASEFLRNNNLDNKIIVAQTAWSGSAVVPYLDRNKKFYYGECGRYGTYYINDSCYFLSKWSYPIEYSVDAAYDKYKDSLQNVVLLLSYPVEESANTYLDLIYASPEGVIRADERYYIYRFKPQVK